MNPIPRKRLSSKIFPYNMEAKTGRGEPMSPMPMSAKQSPHLTPRQSPSTPVRAKASAFGSTNVQRTPHKRPSQSSFTEGTPKNRHHGTKVRSSGILSPEAVRLATTTTDHGKKAWRRKLNFIDEWDKREAQQRAPERHGNKPILKRQRLSVPSKDSVKCPCPCVYLPQSKCNCSPDKINSDNGKSYVLW